jgi:hypothetical protein
MQKLTCMDTAGAGTRDLLSYPWCADLARYLRDRPSVPPFVDASADAARVDCPKLLNWSEREGMHFM